MTSFSISDRVLARQFLGHPRMATLLGGPEQVRGRHWTSERFVSPITTVLKLRVRSQTRTPVTTTASNAVPATTIANDVLRRVFENRMY